MLTLESRGLYCRAGNFYIDPRGAVEHAVVTHAHSDHARRGSRQYYSSRSGAGLLKSRLGKNIAVKHYEFNEVFEMGGVRVSFHPAGHILGSSQVRLEYGGEVWVASGDYKREADPTCEPFESVACDVFVTEATFGTPGFTWPKVRDLGSEIFEWWQANAAVKINSVLLAYSLGKTQRILGELARFNAPGIYCDPAARDLNACYVAEGIQLAKSSCLSELKFRAVPEGSLIIATQAFLKSAPDPFLGAYRTAFASGWMAGPRSHFGGRYDKGFLMSDHADWDDLLMTIKQTGATRIYVQHRGNGALVKYLRACGLKAFPDTELVAKDPFQLAFF